LGEREGDKRWVRESREREIGLCVRGLEMPAMRRGEWGERETEKGGESEREGQGI